MPAAHGIMHILDSVSGKSRPLSLASNVLSVDNSANTQPVSASSLPLPSGAATESTLASVLADTNIVAEGFTACDTGAVVISSSALPSGAASQVSNAAIASAVAGVTSALGGTLSTTAAVSKSASTVNNASSVSSGDLSAAHDARQHRKLAIFGTTSDTSNNIDIHVSADGVTYYKLGQYSIFPASDQSFSLVLDAAFGYIKLKYNGTATVTAIIAGSN